MKALEQFGSVHAGKTLPASHASLCNWTEIEWLPGKSLTQKVLKKKPKKGSKNAKPITKTENCENFFNFFNPPQVPEDDDDIDEDTAEELQNQMQEFAAVGLDPAVMEVGSAVAFLAAVKLANLEVDDVDLFRIN